MSNVSRRRLIQAAGAAAVATAAPGIGGAPAQAALAPVRPDIGAAAYEFPLGQVALNSGRWLENQNRTLTYLRFVDVNRLLYNFRATHKLSTAGAAPNGGWDAPDFPFRSHMQGHVLTAWAQAWAALGDTTCRDKANTMVAELAKCQANNAAAGFAAGYLSGFPESNFDALENGTKSDVLYYVVHKTLAGLLDVWRLMGSTQARDVLLGLAGWVDARTARLTTTQMQNMLRVEFGGMNTVLADLYQQTGDGRWLTAAKRFDHAAVFDPLAGGQDQLNGLHANTQVPKMIGAAREYKATGTTRYRDIARNFWSIVVGAHSYVIGGNSEAEHFRAPNAIAGYLDTDTCEGCNTYNMLRLTRELWLLDPNNAAYFDYYERALLNHIIGWQNPADPHGHITYFTSLNPGGHRGVGPAWGGGTWSTDYNSFWCCQGTGLETFTKLMDSVYFKADTTLYVNLYTPSRLDWTERGITVAQSTSFPASDTTTLTVTGSATGSWTMRLRIPSWTEGAVISVNGQAQSIAATPGSYAALTRTWTSGDVVTVKLPMSVKMQAANDDENVAAVVFGPTVLSGNYGSTTLGTLPSLDVDSIERTSTSALALTATADGAVVNLGPFFDAHGHNYTVYWNASGEGGSTSAPAFKLYNANSNLVLGVQNMSTAAGGLALQWNDTNTADHLWELVPSGSNLKLRNRNSGLVLGVENMSTTDNARVLQWGDNGTADHLWTLVDNGDGRHKVRNAHTGKLLAILDASTAAGGQAVQDSDNGTADNLWRFLPDGARRLQNVNSGLVIGVQNMSTANGGLAVQWASTGTADHFWTAVLDTGGYFKLRNGNSGKVLGVENASTAAGARVMQWDDNGTSDHRWRLRYGSNGAFRIQCANGGKVLAVQSASKSQGAQIITWDDTGAADHLWKFV